MSIDAYAGGSGRGAASLLHRNRDDDFPDWAGRDLHMLGYTLLNLASDGATSAGMLRAQLPRLGARAGLVTLTVGANALMARYGDSPAAQATIATVPDH